jgi:hypothetical protein
LKLNTWVYLLSQFNCKKNLSKTLRILKLCKIVDRKTVANNKFLPKEPFLYETLGRKV